MFCCVIDAMGTKKLACQVSQHFQVTGGTPPRPPSPIAGVANAEWTILF